MKRLARFTKRDLWFVGGITLIVLGVVLAIKFKEPGFMVLWTPGIGMGIVWYAYDIVFRKRSHGC